MLLAPAATHAAPPTLAARPVIGATVLPVGHAEAKLLGQGTRHTPSAKDFKPFLSINPAALRKAKLAAAQASTGPNASPSATAPSSAAVFNGLNAAGLSAADEGNQPTPPDTTGAIGPTRYMEFVNLLVGVYDRTNLTLLSSTDLGTFTAVPSGLTTSDPQIQWDPQGNRWFYAAIGFATNLTNSYILFGWSKTADPSDLAQGWCRFATFTGTNFPDFPKLGHDANFLMIGANVFDTSKSTLPFVTGDVWAIPKPPASATTCSGSVTVTHFADASHVLKNADGTAASTPVPANTFDSSANGYIVSAHDPSVTPQSKAMVWHMAPGPVLVADGDISVGAKYAAPPSVPQPGTSFLIDSLDGRFTQAVQLFDPSAGAEAVWTQHTVAASGRSAVRWYEFLPGSLAIRQQGQLANATDYLWNAAIAPSSAGNDAMISYNRGSSSQLSLIGAQTRTQSTPLGQMDPGEVILGTSSAANQETLFQGNCSPNPCRWGDYSGATPDPLQTGVVWGANQIDGAVVFGFAQWQTQNFAISTGGTPPQPPAPPTGLNAATIDTSQIALAWNPSGAATSYKIQRSPDGSTAWTQIGTSTTTSFTDTGLAAATTYFYRVLGSNSIGDSAPSSVVSARTATSIPYTQAPQGSWAGVYGVDGSALLGWNGSDLVSIPNATFAVDQGARYVWANPSTDVRAMQSPDGSMREATTASDDNQIRMHLTFNAAYSGTIHIYAVDWDALNRRETITVNDGSTAQTANITTDFTQGAWVNAAINVAAGGTMTVVVTHTAGRNAVVSGVILGGAPPAPAAPTALAASAVSSSQIKLTWTGSSGATGYQVQRSPDGTTGWAQVGTSAATSFTDSGLLPSTTYFYRVLATNGPGLSAPSNVASTSTAAGLPFTQSPQGSWAGVYGANGSALLGWNGSDLVSIPNATFTVDQGARYVWANPSTDVRAMQSPDGSIREATTASDDNQIRMHITFSSAYSGTVHIYAVDWDALSRRQTITVDDGSGPQTAYLNADFSQGAWVSAPVNVAAGGTVTVVVTHTGGRNAVVSGVILGGPPPAPAAPTGLAATAPNASQVNLSWNASTGATGYQVQRSPDGTTGWTQVGTSATTSFTDSGLIPSTTYFYRVLATNPPGISGPSNVASTTTPAGLPFSQSPQGSWVGVYGADGYALLGWGGGDLVSIPGATLAVDQGQRYVWANPSSDVRALQSGDASTRQATTAYDANQVRMRITFSKAYSGTVHVYAVDWDAQGRRETITVNDGSGPQTAYLNADFSQGAWVSVPVNVAAGGTVSVSVTRTAGLNVVVSGIILGGPPPAPAPPTGVAASAPNSSQITVTWTAVGGATSYAVQRSPDGSTGWAQVGTITTTSFTDSFLIPSTTYFYRVIASNGPGFSAPSSVVSATTTAGLPVSQSPQGSWVGVYGTKGYALLGWSNSDLISIAGATCTIDQGSRYVWAGSTTDVRALQSPDATSRQAATAYDANQVRIHLTFSSAFSGTLHVYAVDWDGLSRRETITINDGSGPQTAYLNSDFSQGAWINVPINVAAGGTVTVTVTRVAGLNTVVSGIFLG
ncbi:MAG TPA: fibronectin type III domain-containing protein [Candidatus Dormibacteraeota bacterium]|nr:fibronectin type III domain-containing protein [Candidatus Dormibacteraeota bacterium]